LPGPLPFILSRTYSSYRTKTPAPVGSLGPGWKMPADIRLQLRDNTLILSDNGGRSLYFEHLFPGEDGYSRSESLWLVRGGVLKLDEGHRLAALWQALPEELRLSPHRYLATNSPQGPWWLLGWCERVPEADEVLPAPLPPYRVLTGLVDRFGRTQTFHREAGGEFSGGDNTLILSDNGGRSLYFEHLFPGEDGYSRSESLWLVRGGVAKLDEGHRLAALWQALPEELRLSPHRYLATNSPQGPWWVLGWCERVPEADEVLPAPLPPYRVLTGLVDRFGRTQTFHREAGGEFSGEITGVT
ncbi:DUF6531 domain-containing protein, partial [Escherichia coli]|uniref:DUF6531 domain-containing protein n=1 Tax=Escherichia coli TaxID=562 RepID=UPI002167A6DF